eukprot:3603274-Amphidinium_carterae.1
MQNRGSHYRTQSASSHRHEDVAGPMKSRCAARNGDDQRDIPHLLSDRDVTGEIPRKGWLKRSHAESDNGAQFVDPATHCQEGQHVEPVRKVMTGRDNPHLLSDRSVSGRSDPNRKVSYQVERQANPSVITHPPRKRQRSDSSYSDREDAEIEIQDLR